VYERAAAGARAFLSGADFAAAFDEGRTLPPEEAIAAARSALAAVATTGSRRAGAQPAEIGLPLSPRELAVLRLVAAGCTDREVATALELRVRTVNSHLANIRRKLGVPSRAAAAVEAVRLGLA